MRRALAVTAVLGAGALAFVPSWPDHEARAPDLGTQADAGGERKMTRFERDVRQKLHRRAFKRKRVRPATPRTTPAELAQRNRVAAAESAKILARAELRKRAA